MDKKSCDNEKKSMIMGKAILKLSAYVNCGMLTVHILKARHLHSKEIPHCHPFVQVCLVPDSSGGTKCCTAVTQSTPHPTFNEMFSFELLLPTDSKKRLQVTVWNSQVSGSANSEFLGAMSFGLNSLLNKSKAINGWYYLLKEDVGKKKHLPAIMRSAIYGEIGSPLQSPDCPETPLMEPRHTKISQTNGTQLVNVMVHKDVNGNTTNKTEGDCLNCPPFPSPRGQTDGHYFDHLRAHGQMRSFHSSFRLGKTPDCAHTELTTVNHSPIVSSKHVRFNTSEGRRPGNTTTGVPTNLPVPEKSALKSPPMRRSQNPFVLQYRQEIASVEHKVRMNCQKSQNSETGANLSGQGGTSDIKETTPDIIQGEESTGKNTILNEELSNEHTTSEASKVPVSVMGYPSQFRKECEKVCASISNFQAPASVCASSQTTQTSRDCREIWIDCQSLESTNTTQDSGICDSSSPKSEEHCCHRKYQETSFCSTNGDSAHDRTASVYKDAHLEPSVKCKGDMTSKYIEQFQLSPERKLSVSKAADVASSSQNVVRSKLSSASFCSNRPSGFRENPYAGCESCTVKYYRHLYSPVLGQRRLVERQEPTHTKVYFL